MKFLTLGNSDLSASVISLGCMRMAPLELKDAADVLTTALESGIDFFDHADIYGGGKSEEVFARALQETNTDRASIKLQSKCGIRKGYFDFSRDHILASVEGSLRRLNTDYLDVLLLHRPDALLQPEEIASAFSELHAAGKVRHFGVSNQNPSQMELLRRSINLPLVANQLQLGLGHTPMIDHGLNVNMADNPSVDRDNGALEYCRLHRITVQPWSPMQAGFFNGAIVGHPEYPELNRVLDRIAAEHDASPAAVAIAWLLRHPADMQPVIGSMTPQRIRDMCRSPFIHLSRPEWYELYRAAGNRLP